jgi:hypothetical protein
MRAQPTVAAPRADWMILRMHYLRIVRPLAAVCFGTLLALLAMTLLVSNFLGSAMMDDPGYGLDVTALVLSMFVALPTGAAVFSRQFKEQHILTFQALPVSRLRQWTLFAASSLLALLTVYAGFALLRPGLWKVLGSARSTALYGVILAISFAAGLCFALIGVRTVSVYMTAYIASIAAPVLVGLALAAPYIAHDPPTPHQSLNDLFASLPDIVDLPAAVPWLAALAIIVIFAAASALFYIRGEMTLLRVQIRNALIVGGAFLLLALITTPLVYSLAKGKRELQSWDLSDDGRYMAAWYWRKEAPWKTELRVHDLATGASQTWKPAGVAYVHWNAKNELVTYARDMSWWRRLWYLRPPRDRVQRWSPRGELLGELRLDGWIARPRMIDARQRAVLVIDGQVVRVIAIEDGERPRQLIELPAPTDVRFGESLISFDFPAGEPRAWRIGPDGMQELTRAPVASERAGAWIVDGLFYPDADAALRKIEASWPAPRAAGDRVAYHFHAEGTYVYALVCAPQGPAKLYVMDGATKQWTLITDAIALGPVERPREAVSYYSLTTASSTFFGTHVALFTERAGDRILHRLHDPRRNVTMTFFDRPAAGDERTVNMLALKSTVPEASRILVDAGQQRVFEAIWENGQLKVVPRRPGGMLAGMWPDGTQVRYSHQTVSVVNEKGLVRSVNLLAE